MKMRTRKLVGTFIIVPFIVVYTFMAMLVAVSVLPGSSGLTQLIYYVVAGLVWIIPVGWVIRWMVRPDAEAN